MKLAIIFYSFSGNTEKACLFLKNQLTLKNISVDLMPLKPKREESAFLKQCAQAFFKKKPGLEEVNYELGSYDLIVFASPVWAFTFAPALHSYFKKVKGLEEKETACFLTFGSGTGSARALGELKEALRRKNARIIFSKAFAGSKTKDDTYLEEQFKSLLGPLSP